MGNLEDLDKYICEMWKETTTKGRDGVMIWVAITGNVTKRYGITDVPFYFFYWKTHPW